MLVGLSVHRHQRRRPARPGRRRAPRRRRRTPATGPRPRPAGPAPAGRPRRSPPTASTARPAPRRRSRHVDRAPRRGPPGRPVRTAPASARPPSSSPSAVTTMVLPAPVSPVIAVKPGTELEHGLVDHAQRGDPQLLKHRAALRRAPPSVRRRSAAPRQPSTGRSNLATSRSVNGAWCSRTSRTGVRPRRTSMRAPGGRSTVRRPSHHSTPAPSVRAITSTASTEVGRDHQRPREERVGADRHHQQRLDPRPHDRVRRR